MKNWTKWYKKTLENAREDNKSKYKASDELSDREKATWELLMKQYGLTEKAVADTQKELREINNETNARIRENEVKKTLAKSKVNEKVAIEGKNNFNAVESEKQEINRSYKDNKERLKSANIQREDNEKEKLNEQINEIEDNIKTRVKQIDDEHDKIADDVYTTTKNRIDYLLKKNDTGKGDIFFDIKDELLSIINSKKDDLTEERYKELNTYVNSKIFIDKDSLKENVTIPVNGEELIMTAREFEWSTKVEFKPISDIGLVYGELINVIYDNTPYKVKIGLVLPNEEANIANAIVKVKGMKLKVGTCIAYNGKLYTYAGEDVWRRIIERGSVNSKDGLHALMTQFNDDIFADANVVEEE